MVVSPVNTVFDAGETEALEIWPLTLTVKAFDVEPPHPSVTVYVMTELPTLTPLIVADVRPVFERLTEAVLEDQLAEIPVALLVLYEPVNVAVLPQQRSLEPEILALVTLPRELIVLVACIEPPQLSVTV